MTSKIKVDNINKVSDDSNIIKKCGSTITLGASGDSIALASGASQTGFGRTGTVDWQTTPKTAGTFTAVSGEGYFLNTSGGLITANLPAGVAGAIVSFADYAATWQTSAVTVVPNGTDKIGAVNANAVLNTEGQSVTLVYVDGTQGWINTMDSTSNVRAGSFICASVSGACNTLTTVDTNFKVAKFVGPGTFTVNSGAGPQAVVDYMIVAGGGGGGSGNGGGGGGGAGGWRGSVGTSSGSYNAGPGPLTAPVSAVPVSVQAYTIVVGGGGPGAPGVPEGGRGTSGINSTALGLTSAGGGGGGGTNCTPSLRLGAAGGSGGGSAKGPSTGGAGNTPSVTPSQGNPGGNTTATPPTNNGAGGGGAGDQGETVPWQNERGGNGGIGVTSSITGSPVGYAGGGGANSETGNETGGTGGVHSTGGTPSPSAAPSSPRTALFGGGNGHGGSGSVPINATPGGINTGGGGGGIDYAAPYSATNGGSGIVVIRYKFQ